MKIDEEKIPFSGVARQASDDSSVPLRNFLYGGGDWNLVLAMPKERLDSLGELGVSALDGSGLSESLALAMGLTNRPAQRPASASAPGQAA